MSEDPRELERFYAETIEPLAAYDEQYETELVATVEAYLDNDGNVAATAKQLFTHRHTIRYRLERAKELCGHDVSATEGREKLGLGLKAMRVLGIASPARPGAGARRRGAARSPRVGGGVDGSRDSGGRTRTLASWTKTRRASRLHHPGSTPSLALRQFAVVTHRVLKRHSPPIRPAMLRVGAWRWVERRWTRRFARGWRAAGRRCWPSASLAIFIGCVAILVPAVASVGDGDLHRLDPADRRRLPGRRRLHRALDRHRHPAPALGAPDRDRRLLADRRTAQRHPDPDPRARHLLPLHGGDPDHRRLPRPRPAEGAGLVGLSGIAGLLVGILILAKFPELRRLGDRPAGRHRPDLRRLDAHSVALVGKDLAKAA